jgi:hypothetical protein
LKRGTWILLAAVALLVAAIFLWERKQPTTDEREEGKLKVFDIQKAEVTVLVRSGESPLQLKRVGEDRWDLVSPFKDLADRNGVEGLIERLNQTRALRFVQPGAASGPLGLDKPRATWTLTSGSRSTTLEVGAKAALGEGLYVRTGGKIALLPPDLESLLLKAPDDFRLKSLTAAATQEVKSLEFRGAPRESLAAHRDPKVGWLITAPFQDWGSAAAIEEMLDDVSLCLVDAFVPAGTDAKTLGLAPPQCVVRLEMEKGGPVEIALGGPVPGSDPAKKLVYASVSGRPSPMTVSSNSLRFLTTAPEAFRSLEVLPADAFEAQGLRVTGKVSVSLKREGEKGWTFQGAAPKGATDAGGLPAALAALRGEKAIPWQGPATAGFGSAEITFVLKGPGGEQRMAVGQEVEGRRLAHPEGRPVALLLPKEGWATVEAALKLSAGGGGAPPVASAGKAP